MARRTIKRRRRNTRKRGGANTTFDIAGEDYTDREFSNELRRNPYIDEIRQMMLSENHITNIDAIPDTVEVLDITGNPVEEIHHLPANLTVLVAPYCPLKKIDYLPENLEILHLAENELSELPAFPDTLGILYLWRPGISDDYVINIPAENQIEKLTIDKPYDIHCDGKIYLNEFMVGEDTYTHTADLPAKYRGIIEMFGNNVNNTGSASAVSNTTRLNKVSLVPQNADEALNVFMTDIKTGNVVARISGNNASTYPGDYAVVSARNGEENSERKRTIKRQMEYLRNVGNPLTREAINMSSVPLRIADISTANSAAPVIVRGGRRGRTHKGRTHKVRSQRKRKARSISRAR
jgi:hypothetical protein